jgi:hypothetical protein
VTITISVSAGDGSATGGRHWEMVLIIIWEFVKRRRFVRLSVEKDGLRRWSVKKGLI